METNKLTSDASTSSQVWNCYGVLWSSFDGLQIPVSRKGLNVNLLRAV